MLNKKFFLRSVALFFLLVFSQLSFANTDAKFLSLSDIHFDPFVNCSGNPCPLIEDLRNNPVDQWQTILDGYYKKYPSTGLTEYKKDTKYPLLAATLDKLKNTKEKLQFVLVLGDFLGHDYKKHYQDYTGDQSQEGYQAFVKKTMEFLTNQLTSAFPEVNVYAAIGNNDSYQDDYVSDPNGPFFKDLSVMWSTALVKDAEGKSALQNQFPAGGYYAVDIPNTHLHLIVMNTSLFSAKAEGKEVDVAALAELNWFEKELTKANSNQQKVLIALHIPAGIDVYATVKKSAPVELWKSQYTTRFLSDLASAQIEGIIPAHLHADWFQVLNDRIPVASTPAISPLFGNNPGFKIISFDEDKLTDFVTLNYSVEKQSWNEGVEYDFNQVYQPACSQCNLLDGMKLLSAKETRQDSNPLAQSFIKFYSMGTMGQPIAKGKWNPYYWCAIQTADVEQYQSCLKGY